MIINNIDVDQDVFEELSSYLRTQTDADDTQLFLFHQRKSTVMDDIQLVNLLETVKSHTDLLAQQCATISSISLIDCCGKNVSLHSDFSLLAEIMTLLSSSLEPDASAEVLLLDYNVLGDKHNSISHDEITFRNVLDPSILEDTAAQAVQELDELANSIDLSAISVSEQDISLIMEKLIHQMQDNYPNANAESA